jgi:endonuclease-3 related protein
MNPFQKLYLELKNKYKKEKGQWSLWCKRKKNKKEREEIIIGAILTQRTNWKNVELALNNLKKANINSLKDICLLGEEKLAPLIRPSGFYKVKAGYLFDLACFIFKEYGSLDSMKKVDFEFLRNELLRLKGIGPETADSILLYALDKPVFVVDEYTRRLVKERKLAKKFSYNFLQNLFEKNLKKDLNLYQDFHALIVIHGKSKKQL